MRTRSGFFCFNFYYFDFIRRRLIPLICMGRHVRVRNDDDIIGRRPASFCAVAALNIII